MTDRTPEEEAKALYDREVAAIETLVRVAEVLGLRDRVETFPEQATAAYGAFHSEQEALQREIGGEPDPEQRRILELRKGIEVAEYMAITSQRLANLDRLMSGRYDTPGAALDEDRANAYREQASDLRDEREALLSERLARDAAADAQRVRAIPSTSGSRTTNLATRKSRTLGRAVSNG
jgi:hypothetical protein